VEGRCGDQFVRQGLQTSSWQLAHRRILEAEARGRWTPEEGTAEMTLEVALAKFEQDAVVRALAPATLHKYRELTGQLRRYAGAKGIRFLSELDVDTVREFRATWVDCAISGRKKLERLRMFFRFGVDSGWITANPAARIRSPRVTEMPTLPFDDAEMERIYGAVDRYTALKNTDHSRRLRPLIQLLEHSGLRMGDAVMLSTKRIHGDKLFLHTQKTRVKVFVPLPDFVVRDLENLPLFHGEYFFWIGTGTKDTIATNYRRSLRAVFELAGVENGHPHRFRDTFAVNLLRHGVPIERIARLLGHSSVKVTEKHYWPWVTSLQEQLEEDVRKTWIRRYPTLSAGETDKAQGRPVSVN
jgi:integrase